MNINDFNNIRDYIGFSDGIMGKDEYFNSAVMILLISIKDEYYIIFQQRNPKIRQGSEICFPGGGIEVGETPLAAALRETNEELGINIDKIRVIGKLDTVIAPMGAIIDSFIGIVDIEVDDIVINKDEVEKIILIPLSYFLEQEPDKYYAKAMVHPTEIDNVTGAEIVLLPAEELGLPELYKKPWGNLKYGVYVYHTSEGRIWGITARIIREFSRKVNELI